MPATYCTVGKLSLFLALDLHCQSPCYGLRKKHVW